MLVWSFVVVVIVPGREVLSRIEVINAVGSVDADGDVRGAGVVS